MAGCVGGSQGRPALRCLGEMMPEQGAELVGGCEAAGGEPGGAGVAQGGADGGAGLGAEGQGVATLQRKDRAGRLRQARA